MYVEKRTVFFWIITQVVTIPYRRFGKSVPKHKELPLYEII